MLGFLGHLEGARQLKNIERRASPFTNDTLMTLIPSGRKDVNPQRTNFFKLQRTERV